MQFTYKYRIFFVVLTIFAAFSACLIFFEQHQERKQNTAALVEQLANFAAIIDKKIKNDNISDGSIAEIKSLEKILPDSLRLTILKQDGKVLYDRDFTDVSHLDNHLKRPEILKAQYGDFGINIRHSASVNRDYIYYAKFFSPYFVRVALPYNVHLKSLLKADNLFIYIVLALLILVLLVVNYISGRFGKSILQLKNFAENLKNNRQIEEKNIFPNDELGEIGRNLAEIFCQKENLQKIAETEKEKLLQHFQHSETGIAIFDKELKKIFANSHFIQNQNIILNKPSFDVEAVFKDENFEPLKKFLFEQNENHINFQIEKNGKIFDVQSIIFEDKSLEIDIKDITQTEKNRLLKQEMTNNIAHELRTPVSSLRAYLETLNEHNLPPEKHQQFIERAYIQAVRLSALIEDVSLLSKIEENPSRFSMENINISQLLNDVRIDLSEKLQNNNINFKILVNEQLTIKGNYTLLYSVFRNLMDNSIAYGGQNIDIEINNYFKDDKFLYFSYFDSGVGVQEHHLNRLFERFYRVQEGRSRENGGSGLGLSIVKNAILMHGGEIQARTRKEGGLEFVFTIKS
jgi:two-component system OmpR family sensor kinase/two-component system phosphate regulon sensor histidine kinase PhoR